MLTWNRLINKLSNKSVHKGEGHKLLHSDRIDCIRSDWAKLVSSYVLAPNLSTKQMTFTRQIAQVGKIRLVQLLQIESLRRWQWPSGHGDQTSAGETRLCQQCPTPRRLWLISLFCSASSAYGDSGNEMLGIKESEPGHTGVCLVLCVSDNHHGPTPRCLSKGSDFFLYVFFWEKKKMSFISCLFYCWHLMWCEVSHKPDSSLLHQSKRKWVLKLILYKRLPSYVDRIPVH